MRLSKTIKGYKNYTIYNDGSIYSTRSKKYITPFQVHKTDYAYFYIQLYNNRRMCKSFNLARLVLKHFKPSELSKKMKFPLHLDSNTKNNRASNLTSGTRGDRRRIINAIKKTKRGVYKWTDGYNVKWRAVLKIDNKPITLGYFQNKEDAHTHYFKRFKEVYGYAPY